MTVQNVIPVIDLFAGPGGLCEGFSSVRDEAGNSRFAVNVSIEKDPVTHRTLHLRAMFRKFPKGKAPDIYYQYIRGEVKREDFLAHPDIKGVAAEADQEARCAELGVTPPEVVDGWISAALGTQKNWVLIGGPPCQAYSLAGRSRLRGKSVKEQEAFESDKRHFLYTEYLRIIQQFEPSVFVMENVKGMLNSTHGGTSIFERIMADLREPKEGLNYEIRSLVVDGIELEPRDYVIQSEHYGIPQCRHRVILFGIRADVVNKTPELTVDPRMFLLRKAFPKVDVETALSGMPAIRSRISKEEDSHKKWLTALRKTTANFVHWHFPIRKDIMPIVKASIERAKSYESAGSKFMAMKVIVAPNMPKMLKNWLLDERVGGVIQHESRSHMVSDLHRYMFASSYAQVVNYSPTLRNFPPLLLPDHVNVDADSIPFLDRFRVQVKNDPASTVVAHIQKDGHYYIHHDPAQCRSLTVREAARLQTFPDNYFFEGNRTQQYGQVGNAVPPLLARKIAKIIFKFLSTS
ncbi:MAG: DNA cytosine methyltransferase, partial [Rhodoferax sp.]|nr:DNA cytosine methyltransferase [Rhodoferax sp.]